MERMRMRTIGASPPGRGDLHVAFLVVSRNTAQMEIEASKEMLRSLLSTDSLSSQVEQANASSHPCSDPAPDVDPTTPDQTLAPNLVAVADCRADRSRDLRCAGGSAATDSDPRSIWRCLLVIEL